jgi:hypothetical protein
MLSRKVPGSIPGRTTHFFLYFLDRFLVVEVLFLLVELAEWVGRRFCGLDGWDERVG